MKKTTAFLPLILSAFLCAIPLAEATSSIQQQTPPAVQAQLEAMKKLSWMLGEWRGEGWIEFGPGNRRTFKQSESIRAVAGGLGLMIEGLGTGMVPGRPEPVVVHSAFALVSYSESTAKYRWFAMRAADGVIIDVAPEIRDRGYLWAFTDPRAGNIRFTARVTDKGQWVEVGEGSRDGKNWQQFFEMTLDRVK